MDEPSELSLAEIRNYMLENGNKVTNHALVKHFRKFLTNPGTQNEARKQFKTYVNTLATIKNENNQKYLILRSKYLYECPTEGAVDKIDSPASPGGSSIMSEGCGSPFRQPPPYKPPPEVSPVAVKIPILQQETKENYRDCVNEFAAAVNKIDPGRLERKKSEEEDVPPPSVPPRKRSSVDRSISRENSIEENKENVSIGSSESSSKICDGQIQDGENMPKDKEKGLNDSENQISVKEATRKFNRMASEEETKVLSPSSKKKPEKATPDEKPTLEVTIAHPKAKEWIVVAAKAEYQDLAKLALDHPELVKLQDPTTGYTALHWAAKHGNEDVVKLIAGTYKADVNARTNGGYTPLHLAMQFGRDNIFELLCNVYKANRDLADWSGNKPLDYRKQRTTVSASTYSSEYNFLLQTVPRRKKTNIGGAFVSMRKKSHPRHQAAGSIARGHSMFIPQDYHRSLPQQFFGDRSLEMPQYPTTNLNGPSSPGFQSDDQVEYRGGKMKDRRNETRYSRKGSFLRKKLKPVDKNNSTEIASNN